MRLLLHRPARVLGWRHFWGGREAAPMSDLISLSEAAHNLEIGPDVLQQWVERGLARGTPASNPEQGGWDFERAEVQRLILEKHLILSQSPPGPAESRKRPKVRPPRSLDPESATGERDRRRRMGRRASDFTLELLHQEIRTAVAAALSPLQAQLEQLNVAPTSGPAPDLQPEMARLQGELAEAQQLLERSEKERHRWQLKLQEETAANLDELKGQLQHLEEAREQFRQKLAQAQQEKEQSALRHQEELQRQRLQHQQELEHTRLEHERRLEQLREETEGLRRELDQARSGDLTMDAERARWSLELHSLQGEVDRLTAVQAGWDEQKRELEQQLQQLRHKSEQQERSSQREQDLESEVHRLQELIKSLNYKLQMAGPGSSGPTPEDSRRLLERLSEAEAEMAQKNQLIQQNYAEISELGSKLDALQRSHYELQQRHERLKEDWSQLAAKQINELQQQQQQPPPSSLPSDRKGGWGGLFRMRGDS